MAKGEQSLLQMPTARTESIFFVHADEKLSAFLKLERAICIYLVSKQC